MFVLALTVVLVAVSACGGSEAADPEPERTRSMEPSEALASRPLAGDPGRALRYVALGDSYTIGTSVQPDERWPDQLVARMREDTPRLDLVANLGVNGYTSRDVIERELPELDGLRPEFVSLLVGVNDVVQRVPTDQYEANATAILDALLDRLPPERVVAIATPDYTVTPAGADYGDPGAQAAGIARNNKILERLARERDIAWVDIHSISLLAKADRSLVADDGLHPSGAQYARWVERILPTVRRLIRP